MSGDSHLLQVDVCRVPQSHGPLARVDLAVLAVERSLQQEVQPEYFGVQLAGEAIVLLVASLMDRLEKLLERRDLLPELHLGGQEPRVFEEFIGES